MKPTKPFWSTNAVWAISIIGIIAFVIILHSLFNGDFPPENPNPLKKKDTTNGTPILAPATFTYEYIQGRWMVTKGEDYCIIAQQKNGLSINYLQNGKTSMQGTGTIYGRDVTFSVKDSAIGKIEFELVVSKEGNKMIGRMTNLANGQSSSKRVTFIKSK